MGWQKQGKGHNSSTGQAAIMGLIYGKVMIILQDQAPGGFEQMFKKTVL